MLGGVDDRALMSAALEHEAEGQRALLAGRRADEAFATAAAQYRASWEAARRLAPVEEEPECG